MPDVSDVHVDSALTNVSVQYNANQFVSNRLLPVVPVGKQMGKYFICKDGPVFSRRQLGETLDVEGL